MAWVVDTCLLLDIGLDDPPFAEKTEQLLVGRASDGLMICPVTFVELAPAFGGQVRPLREFLFNLGIEYREDWSWEDTTNAHAAWARHVQRRRAGETGKRPVADILIGAFASRFEGLLTGNAGDFTNIFPQLTVAEPDQE
jgi:predicted nucleic acid-binding protein